MSDPNPIEEQIDCSFSKCEHSNYPELMEYLNSVPYCSPACIIQSQQEEIERLKAMLQKTSSQMKEDKSYPSIRTEIEWLLAQENSGE